MWHRRSSILLVVIALALGIRGEAEQAVDDRAPTFGKAFWDRWGDGRGELAGYDLTIPRYGSPRKGVAVTIFVTETFSESRRVKSDPGRRPASDEFPVMKLNLVQDFATGIYDYNLMTSTFLALVPRHGRPAGSATKVSFSSQEWCGNVYRQLLFDSGAARHTMHSYFDGEADRVERIDVPARALDGDALLLWARGFAAPLVARGEAREVTLVRSLKTARLRHQPIALESARLACQRELRAVTVPAGRFMAEVRTVAIRGGPTWTFAVEAAEPHRVLEWSSSEGESARLLASERLVYWELNRPGGEAALEKLGLKPRPPRTP